MLAAFLLSGAFAGMMSGLLGIGGGIVVVPALFWIFERSALVPADILMHMSAGTSLTAMLFTALSSVFAHARRGNIRMDIYRRLAPGIAIGTVCGAIFADTLPTRGLEILFGLFLLFIAAHMLWHVRTEHAPHTPSRLQNLCVSLLIGLKSGLLGIGGGALIVPYLSWCGVSMRALVPVSALCTFTVAMIGSLSFMLTGRLEPLIPPLATGYVYWPAVFSVGFASALFAPLGAHWAWRVPERPLRVGFVVLLILTALGMLL